MDELYYLQGILFAWDIQKDLKNQVKHNISFKRACEAFFDPFLCVMDATRNFEERDAIIGEDASGRLLFVVHIQQQGDLFRIISARRATRDERNFYESQ